MTAESPDLAAGPAGEPYVVIRRSADSAEADPVVLRETETTRLVFKPLLVNNAQDAEAPLKGTFVFQKKRKADAWEDHDAVPLSSLRAGEGVRLELRSAELHKLLSHAAGLYRLYKREGLPRGETHFLKVSASGPAGDAGPLSEWLKRAGPGADAALLEWLTDAGPESPLARLAPADLARLDRLAGVNALRQLLQLWESNQENADEAFWQRRLGEYDFLLAWLFACPMVLIQPKAYVGGKNLHNQGGHEVDFLLAHPHTGNAGLVEIKTPATPLLGRSYRGGGVYGASADLSGAIAQVLSYRQSLLRHIDALNAPEGVRLRAHCPRCLVLIGHMGREWGDDRERARSFELFRGALAGDLVVLTFDELFGKARRLLEYLEGAGQTGPAPAATPSS